MKKQYFIVSDVHGFYTPMKEALDKAGFELNNPMHYLIVAGDLFDRGAEAVKLFNFVRDLGDRFIYIRGNHEELLQDCMYQIQTDRLIDEHHFHNKTVETILQFTGCILIPSRTADELAVRDIILSKMAPVMDFIEEKSIYCYEIGDYIITHAWLPLIVRPYPTDTGINWDISPIPYWNKQLNEIPDAADRINYVNEWGKAIWCNPFSKWKSGYCLPNKTVICGHWNSSYANCLYHNDGVEFSHAGNMNYHPFVDKGIIGLDACTAYTNKVNCIVIEEN